MNTPPTSATSRPGDHLDSTRKLVRYAALAYLAFVIYGSLVPLDFRAVGMAQAMERFAAIPFLDLGIGSRADWVANLLLFIPLSYLLAASLWPRQRSAQWATTVAIALACGALSVAIEFTQIFFPPRTVSQNDILAEALGGVLGLAVWWRWGPRSLAWLASWQRVRGAAGLAERLLWLYLLLVFGYNVLPLDLTISLAEIYHKWSEGRLNLIPFAATPTEPVRFLYEVTIDMLLWAPVSLLAVLSGRATRRQAVLWTLAAAALLEALQLLVFSRFSDVTDLITAVPGALAGVWLAGRIRPQVGATGVTAGAVADRRWLIVAAIAGWCLVLAAVFWYPFDFSRDLDLVRRGMDGLLQVPFVSYYFGSELRAITEVFHKVGFFLPLGALFAWMRWSLGYRAQPGWMDAMPLLVLFGPPAVIELGQVGLPGKFPGSTDLVLEWFGAAIGYLGLIALARRWQRPENEDSVQATVSPPAPSAPQGAPAIASPYDYLLAAGRVPQMAPPEPARRQSLPSVAPLTPFIVAAAGWTGILVLAMAVPAGRWALLPGVTDAVADGRFLPLLWAVAVTMLLLAVSRFLPDFPASLFAAARGRTGILAAGTVLLVALLPLRPDALLPASLAHGFGEPGQRLYALLKAAILWVPLGVIAGVAGTGSLMGRWVVAGAVGFIAVTLPLAGDMRVSDFYEVLAAPLGVGLGAWIASALVPAGAGSRSRAPQAVSTAPAVARPVAPVDTPMPASVGAPATLPPVPEPADGGGEPDVPRRGSAGPSMPLRVLSIGLLLSVLGWAWFFPAFGPALCLALVVYFATAVYRPAVVLVVLPWALPALDLAPWTGRTSFDEFDLLLLASLAVVLWHWPPCHARHRASRGLRVLFWLFALSSLGALLAGLLPLQPLDDNAFSSYRSHYNALRVGKGFLWAAVLVGLIRLYRPGRGWQLPVLVGSALGLISVGLVAVWERWLFASLWDFSVDYRVMATFSSMHVGGAHIEAYLVLALPLAAHLLRVARRPWHFLLAAGALSLGSYVLVSTVARGALLGLAAVALVFVLGAVVQRSPRRAGSLLRKGGLVAISAVVVAVLVAGVGGAFFQERLGRSFQDLQTRLDHWGDAVSIMDDGFGTAMFGMGLGSFPETYLLRTHPRTPLATFRFDSDQGDTHLALGAGETLYFTQRISLEAATLYRLSLRVRSTGDSAVLNTTLCERHLSHSRRCVWPGVKVPGDGEWHTVTTDIGSAAIGHGRFPGRAPVDFALYNPTGNTVIMVDDVQLAGPDGRQLLRNGDFSDASDYWFIKTHEHLSWHIKNLWVAVYFEQGLVGVTLFSLLVLAIVASLARGIRAGSRLAVAVLAGLAGFLAVGTVGSPFDAPRLTFAFFALAAMGLHHLAAGHRRA